MTRKLRSFLAAACAGVFLSMPATAGAATVPPGFEDVLVERDVSGGTGLAFTPDGRMLFNMGGKVMVREPGSTKARMIYDVPGFPFGMAVDSDFASNGFVYFGYVFGAEGEQNLRVSRISLRPDSTVAGPAKVILGTRTGRCTTPDNTNDCMHLASPENHALGGIVSDPRDGTLWITNGDNASPGGVDPLAYNGQDPASLQGKMLHVDRDGRGLPGHAFCPDDADLSHNCTKVHAVGMRNAYRFNLRPSDGLPVSGDVGWEAAEEINVIRKGRNYGWPCYEGSLRTTGYSESPVCRSLYEREGGPDAAVAPVYEYGRDAGKSVIGGPVVADASWPAEYQGDIIFGDYVVGTLKRLKLGAGDKDPSVLPFATAWGAGVDLKFGPGGDLYYVTFGGTGEIRKIRYVGAGNRTPVAVASQAADGPLTVEFNGASSSDPDGDSLTYDWDFGDGSPHSSAVNPTHTYAQARTYTATLTVSDGRGGRHSQSLAVHVGNTEPELSISAPATFRAGEPVTVTAQGSDAEDGELAGTALETTVTLRHDRHDHPMASSTSGGVTRFTPVTDHDADSHYIVTVRATDSRGATVSRSVEIRPQVAAVRIVSDPPGAAVSYGGSSFAAPFAHTSTVGFRTTVSVPATVVSGGRTYAFRAWSDGKPRQHEVTVPSGGLALSASYTDVTGGTAPGAAPAPGAKPQPAPAIDPSPGSGPRVARLIDARISDSRFALGTRVGVRYRLSGAAGVQLTLRQVLPGRRVGSACRPDTRTRSSRPSCSRLTKVSRVTAKGRAGVNRLSFRRSFGGRALKAGRYRITIAVPASDGRAGTTRTLRFTVTR